MDSGLGFSRGLTVAAVMGFCFACATAPGVFFACDGEVATVAGEGGGFSGPAVALFGLVAGVFAEEGVLGGVPLRGCGCACFSVRLSVTAAGFFVTFFPVDKEVIDLD